MVMHLTQLKEGKSGIIVDIQGGFGLIKRLDALGIRKGKVITKKSGLFMQGPIVVQVDNSQVAMGFGMASRIIVEVKKE
jgi:ferrous iron transport protein A